MNKILSCLAIALAVFSMLASVSALELLLHPADKGLFMTPGSDKKIDVCGTKVINVDTLPNPKTTHGLVKTIMPASKGYIHKPTTKELFMKDKGQNPKGLFMMPGSDKGIFLG